MKATFIFSAFAASALAGTPVLVRVTPEALTKLQQDAPMARFEKPPEAKTTAPRPEDASIIRQSMILHDGTHWTLVPKGAVIFLPRAMKSRVDVPPIGTLLAWADFLARNRAWITTNEVSFNQAAGTEPLPAERVAFWAKQDKVVIAIHQSGPISVRIAPEPPTITQR